MKFSVEIGVRCLVDGALGLCSEANYVAEAMAASGLLGSMDLVEVQYYLFLVLVVVRTIPTAVDKGVHVVVVVMLTPVSL